MSATEARTPCKDNEHGINITEALQTISEIQELLSCNSCLRFVENPLIMWNCDHLFCGFCIGSRDSCPICAAPAWKEDQLTVSSFTTLAALSTEMKNFLHGLREKKLPTRAQDKATKTNDLPVVQPNSHNVDNNATTDTDETTAKNAEETNHVTTDTDQNTLKNSDEIIETTDTSVHTKGDAKATGTGSNISEIDIEDTLHEFLKSNNPAGPGRGVITPIDGMQAGDVLEQISVGMNAEVGDCPESMSAETGGKPDYRKGVLISESEIETQLDDCVIASSDVSATEMAQHSPALLAKVANDVLDASMRKLKASSVECSSDFDTFEVEAHQLMPLNQRDLGGLSASNETSASFSSPNTGEASASKVKSAILKKKGRKLGPRKSAARGVSPLSKRESVGKKGDGKRDNKSDGKNDAAAQAKKSKGATRYFKFKTRPFPDICEDDGETQEFVSPLFTANDALQIKKSVTRPGKPTASKKSGRAKVGTRMSPRHDSFGTAETTPITPRNNPKTKSVLPVKSPPFRAAKSKKNKKGETPLHIAAMKGDVSEVRKLTAAKVPLNNKDNAGWTPLHEACHHGHVEVVELLLDAGAHVNTPGFDNETPLIDAARQGHSEIVKMLLGHGADTDMRSSHGLTAVELTTSPAVKAAIENHEISTQAAKNTVNSQSFGTTPPDQIALTHSSALKSGDIIRGAAILNAIVNPKDLSLVTHHITPVYEDKRSPRTLKYLQSVARGVWIVDKRWLDACIEAGGWVREQPYEILGSKEDVKEGGPKSSRINRAAQYPPILHGCHFYLTGSFGNSGLSKLQMSEIIKLAGGTMLVREPKPDSDHVQACTKTPYHARRGTPQYLYTYYVVYDPNEKPVRCVRRGKVCPVPVSWVLGCVSAFAVNEIPA